MKMKFSDFVLPDWPAPTNVKAIQTTRLGGVSRAPYNSLNFGMHVKDNAQHVAQNRQLLSPILPSEPVWLNQVHGIQVVDAAAASCVPEADASYAQQKNVVCVTMTADCLPVLLCDNMGTVVASIHAGWRSLCDGVIEATVAKMRINANDLMAWLGPAIGPHAFEVGGEVRAQFIAKDAQAEIAFKPHGEKWLADIYTIARQRLKNLGVTQVYGGQENGQKFCTYTDEARFFSFRRDGDTGRMATLIWLAK
ncbi:MAG TPA: peptidoglycan editing factor PgeF [Methylotenera sp.]|nr:peptidoglycan editing factor PgeF [Methylotenera sp.]HPH04788.1 peptidoglycan editing factor PgeF [Methylotenera sp.]HPN01589.1 peptidoglycan editing factor PgeF [Methylotenera sp.]